MYSCMQFLKHLYAGKIACMLYAIVGIPFTLIFLSALVQRLLSPTFALLSTLTARLQDMDNFQVVPPP